jgi:hypothetical protein
LHNSIWLLKDIVPPWNLRTMITFGLISSISPLKPEDYKCFWWLGKFSFDGYILSSKHWDNYEIRYHAFILIAMQLDSGVILVIPAESLEIDLKSSLSLLNVREDIVIYCLVRMQHISHRSWNCQLRHRKIIYAPLIDSH